MRLKYLHPSKCLLLPRCLTLLGCLPLWTATIVASLLYTASALAQNASLPRITQPIDNRQRMVLEEIFTPGRWLRR